VVGTEPPPTFAGMVRRLRLEARAVLRTDVERLKRRAR